MRISDQQKYVIIQNARQYFGLAATVYLFGSREGKSNKEIA